MKQQVSPRTAAIIASSLPLMERNRTSIEAMLDARMREDGGDRDVPAPIAAAMVRMLIDHARRIEPDGTLFAIDGYARHHARLAISAEDHGRAAHSLPEALRAVLDHEATPAIVGAWTVLLQVLTVLVAGGTRAVSAGPMAMPD